jgi:hypothetical protein
VQHIRHNSRSCRDQLVWFDFRRVTFRNDLSRPSIHKVRIRHGRRVHTKVKEWDTLAVILKKTSQQSREPYKWHHFRINVRAASARWGRSATANPHVLGNCRAARSSPDDVQSDLVAHFRKAAHRLGHDRHLRAIGVSTLGQFFCPLFDAFCGALRRNASEPFSANAAEFGVTYEILCAPRYFCTSERSSVPRCSSVRSLPHTVAFAHDARGLFAAAVSRRVRS